MRIDYGLCKYRCVASSPVIAADITTITDQLAPGEASYGLWCGQPTRPTETKSKQRNDNFQ